MHTPTNDRNVHNRIDTLVIQEHFSCIVHHIPFVALTMTTLVCYHLPSDRDEAEHPNAFVMKQYAEDVTLKDVKANFPLPGEYHFRFKTRFENGSVFWVDTTDEDARVPVFASNKIVAKVLRLSWKGESRTAPILPANSNHTPKINDLFGSHSPPATKPAHVGHLDLFG